MIDRIGSARALLGLSNDLIVLKAYTRSNRPLARWRSQLSDPIEEHRKSLLKQVDRELESVFPMGLRVFRSRLEQRAKQAR